MRLNSYALLTVVVLLGAVRAQADDTTMFLDFRYKDASAPGKHRKDFAEGIARLSDAYLGTALRKQFACHSYMSSFDMQESLNFQRKKQTLGSGSQEELLALAGSVGATYLTSVSVTVFGDKVSVNVSVTKMVPRPQVIARDQIIFDGEEAHEPLTALANRVAGSLAGSFPKCAGKDWQGSVKVSYAAAVSNNEQSAYRKVAGSGSGELSCELSGEGSEAKCSYTSSDVTTGSGGSIATKKQATAVPTSVAASVADGKLTLVIGSLEVNVVRETPVGSIDGTETLNGETFTVPAKNDPKSQAGAWKEKAGPVDINVNWNLTKP